MRNIHEIKGHIYISSSEEIKVGDWVIEFQKGDTLGEVHFINNEYVIAKDIQNKIILTTDKDLINDGVQAIYNEFLEWFVKNPSCEGIEIKKENICARCYSNDTDECWSAKECSDGNYDKIRYKIIIPEEEPKQETDGRDWFIWRCLDRNNYERVEIPKQETLEEVKKEERTKLFNSIFSVINQIPRKDVDGDAMDASSCAYEIEQLFYKWQAEQFKNK